LSKLILCLTSPPSALNTIAPPLLVRSYWIVHWVIQTFLLIAIQIASSSFCTGFFGNLATVVSTRLFSSSSVSVSTTVVWSSISCFVDLVFASQERRVCPLGAEAEVYTFFWTPWLDAFPHRFWVSPNGKLSARIERLECRLQHDLKWHPSFSSPKPFETVYQKCL
jgi:hypothetical protein